MESARGSQVVFKWAKEHTNGPLLETERAPPSAELRPGEENQTDEDDMKLTYVFCFVFHCFSSQYTETHTDTLSFPSSES